MVQNPKLNLAMWQVRLSWMLEVDPPPLTSDPTEPPGTGG